MHSRIFWWMNGFVLIKLRLWWCYSLFLQLLSIYDLNHLIHTVLLTPLSPQTTLYILFLHYTYYLTYDYYILLLLSLLLRPWANCYLFLILIYLMTTFENKYYLWKMTNFQCFKNTQSVILLIYWSQLLPTWFLVLIRQFLDAYLQFCVKE